MSGKLAIRARLWEYYRGRGMALVKMTSDSADDNRSTLMYIEAEAKMDSYQAQDGSNRTSLNLLQRKLAATYHLFANQADTAAGNFEALSRPKNDAPGNENVASGPESDTDPGHEPLSGVGAS